MAEIEFADGKREIDLPLVGPINRATDGQPKRFTFAEAMRRMNTVVSNDLFRNAISSVKRGHFSPWDS